MMIKQSDKRHYYLKIVFFVLGWGFSIFIVIYNLFLYLFHQDIGRVTYHDVIFLSIMILALIFYCTQIQLIKLVDGKLYGLNLFHWNEIDFNKLSIISKGKSLIRLK